MTKKLFIRYWLPALLWGSLIFSFSSHPTGTIGETHMIDVFIKKFAHVCEYAIFVGLLYRAIYNSGNSKKKSIQISLAITICYAFTDEFHQSFTPTREPHIRDVIIDTIGASASAIILWKYLQKLPKPLKKLAESLDLL